IVAPGYAGAVAQEGHEAFHFREIFQYPGRRDGIAVGGVDQGEAIGQFHRMGLDEGKEVGLVANPVPEKGTDQSFYRGMATCAIHVPEKGSEMDVGSEQIAKDFLEDGWAVVKCGYFCFKEISGFF